MVSHIELEPFQQPSPQENRAQKDQEVCPVTVHESQKFKAGCIKGVLGLAESLGDGRCLTTSWGPQVAPTMSLQVIGAPSTGSKVVLWAESRLPRQTWSISESGHICSQMFEGRILDVKGKLGTCVGESPRGQWSPQLFLTISPLLPHSPQVAGATTGTTRCCGSWPRTGHPRSGLSMCFETSLPPPSPGGSPWEDMFL